MTSWIARRLRFPETTPFTLQLTILFYLAHLLCEGWIGSSQGFLGLALLTGIIATIRGELRIRYHPLYLALLLFLVQPMFAKLLLPLFGGSPAVWTTCMLFFQALLLAGYAYAHASSR